VKLRCGHCEIGVKKSSIGALDLQKASLFV